MNFLKNNWWNIILAIVFVWFCYGSVVYWNMPDGDSFVVLDKIEQMASKSTGKHSSELVLRTFVRIQYENGDVETLRIDDPFVARSYTINQKYTQEETHIFFHDYDRFAFSGWLCGWLFAGLVLIILWINGLERAMRNG